VLGAKLFIWRQSLQGQATVFAPAERHEYFYSKKYAIFMVSTLAYLFGMLCRLLRQANPSLARSD